MSKTSLPPGFRFHPTDVELVCYYLKRKVMGKTFHFEAISEIDLYKFAPWELPDKSILHSKDLEWYFFCPRDRKYPNGPRANRATGVGYWKTTGNDRYVIHKSRSVGTKKTLVFHLGKAPKGDRTNWVMYEYRLQDREFVDAGFSQDAYVLCKIFQKSGPGPKIGEQYGAPFNEEDWEDDTIVENLSFPYRSCPSPRSFNNPSSSSYTVLQQSRAFDAGNVSSNPDLPEDDGISLEQLAEILSAPQLNSDDASAQMSDSAILHGVVNEISAVNIEGIYDDLEDLSAQATITGNIFYLDTIYNEHMLNTIPSVYENEHYVELNDLGFLGEDFTSDFVMPNYPSSQHPIACHPISHNLSNLFDSNSYIDSVITNASGVGDYLHAGPAMILEQSAQDVKIEAFGGSLLNPTCPIF